MSSFSGTFGWGFINAESPPNTNTFFLTGWCAMTTAPAFTFSPPISTRLFLMKDPMVLLNGRRIKALMYFLGSLYSYRVSDVLFQRWVSGTLKTYTIFVNLCLNPVNRSLHWSLCVVINPGHIKILHEQDGDRSCQPMPCLLFLDSLRAHQKSQVRRKVTSWLNSEWERLGKDPELKFPFKAMNILSPRGKSESMVYLVS